MYLWWMFSGYANFQALGFCMFHFTRVRFLNRKYCFVSHSTELHEHWSLTKWWPGCVCTEPGVPQLISRNLSINGWTQVIVDWWTVDRWLVNRCSGSNTPLGRRFFCCFSYIISTYGCYFPMLRSRHTKEKVWERSPIFAMNLQRFLHPETYKILGDS